ncbi:hypothetical protein, partial [Citrobacter freundii]|uniref:hypothetical protein n=1 Tax=Citrobacter freundii TaxID=546 RepID=UPI001B3C90E2
LIVGAGHADRTYSNLTIRPERRGRSLFITTGSTLIKSAYLIDSEQANLRNVQADTTVRRKK